MADINAQWLKDLKREVDALPDCKALAKLVAWLKKMFIKLIEDILDKIAKLVGLIIPPLNLAKIIKYLKNLVARYLGPYLDAIQNMIQMIAAFVDLIAAIQRKIQNLRCNPVAMVKSALKSAVSTRNLTNMAAKALFKNNPDLKTAFQIRNKFLQYKRNPRSALSAIAGALDVKTSDLNKTIFAFGVAKKAIQSDDDKYQHVPVPAAPAIPQIDTPPEVFVETLPPTVESISPTLGNETGGQLVTITGTNFQSGSTVKLGDFACTNITVVSETQITCYTPAGNRGLPVTLTVENPDGQVGTLSNAYAYTTASTGPVPTFGTVANMSNHQMTTGSKNGGDTIRITGANFQNGVTVRMGTLYSNIQVVDGNTLLFTSDYQPSYGKVDIVITNPDGQSVTQVGAWAYT